LDIEKDLQPSISMISRYINSFKEWKGENAMGIGKRTSITGSVRCQDTERDEVDSVSVLLEVASEGNYGISSDLAKNMFGNVMSAIIRGNLPSKAGATPEPVKGTKAEEK
jgi:hypothetical protein